MMMKEKNGDITIIEYSRILFSPMIFAAIAISIIVLLMPFSSFFILAVDMPPSPSPQSPPQSPATTTEKPTGTPPSITTTTTTPPNIPKIEEKNDPKDDDTIISSKTDDGTTTVATKVDKSADTREKNFNRGYVLGVAVVFGVGFKSENVKMSIDQFQKFKENLVNRYEKAPDEFKIGFHLGLINAIQFLKMNKDVLSSGGR
jgi:hypothetical protein